MLGVLKRRWKPNKRASSDRGGSDTTLGSELPLDKPPPMPSPRQIHPLCGEKAGLLSYYDNTVGNVDNFPPPPNIVVEGGRIEFARPTQDGSALSRKSAISRGSQTSEEPVEKSDPLKENLELQIQELERVLHAERLATQRDRATITKLQRQANKREAAQRDVVERERRQRMEAEARLREATAEAERACSRVHHLQRELARMEENTRGLLQHKQRVEQLKQEKSALTLSYEARIEQYEGELSGLRLENESMRAQVRGLEAACLGEVQAALLARLASLESEHAALARDADSQRRQYERCLDEVANQVVRALLSQKGLREEVGALQRRIRELEAHNRRLSGLLQVRRAGAGEALLAALGLDFARGRPRSLELQLPAVATRGRRARFIQGRTSGGGGGGGKEEGSESPESGNRDEGYSTMSSDVQPASEARAGVPSEAEPRGLEDLKEATDETDGAESLGAEGSALLCLPPGLRGGPGAGANRHSFPPAARPELLPYQHLMRSLSDSQLCLRLSVALSVAQCASSLLLSVDEEAWDAEYVQQWLRLETDARAPPPELLELDYDRAELEDWSLELSGSEDLDCRPRLSSASPSKRSSSCCGADDSPDSPSVGTDFTRDFYRLVKFESSRSLASSSGEREPPAAQSKEELLDELIAVPPLAPEELGAVPEEDEEAATSSTPSTVVSPARAALLLEGQLGFPERATSKDVIDELNRMIRSGDEGSARHDSQAALDKLDLACCCPTGWVHIEREIDFTDPKARANLLDVMLASSESSSATSSSGSAASDSGDEPADYRHLHRLHRYRRQKKASAVHAHRVLRLPSNWSSARPSIIGRGGEFFVRYGDKEREAVAYFDFLNDIPLSVAHQHHHQFNGCGSSCGQATSPNPTEHAPGSLLVDLVGSPNGPRNADRMKISPL